VNIASRSVIASVVTVKDQPIENVRTMTQLVARSVTQRRLWVQILSGFAGLAMLLATIGLYGVLAYNVAQRRRELGVRMVLGAQKFNVLSLVVGHGMRLTLAGLGLGLLAALALTRVMGSLLYEVKPSDAITYLGVSGLLLAAALLACWLPARRATKVDPIESLRYE
jgi:putative ABC transport system permease protein